MAWIKPKSGVSLSEEELRAYSKERIAHYKVPKYWKFVDSFPITITGKVRKGEMREISVAELGLGNLLKIKTS
jgi:fatty-acyl-CoA synthase